MHNRTYWSRILCLSAVFPELTAIEKTPLALHGLCVVLLAVCLLTSALSILISLYNSVSNPYETYMGPNGVYTCSSISGEWCYNLVHRNSIHTPQESDDLV